MNELLRAKLIPWAEGRVRQNPTRVDHHDAEGKPVDVPNTVEAELVELLRDHLAEELDTYKANELREWTLDLCTDGTKGYREMNRDELLKEIEEEILCPDLHDEGTSTEEIVADFMEELP